MAPLVPEDIEGVRLRVKELVLAGRLEEIPGLLQEHHPSDVADLLEALDSEEERVALLNALPTELASESLAEMDYEEDPGDLLAALDPRLGAVLLQELDYDDAVDLVGVLEPEDRAKLLAALPIEEAGEIRGLLRYQEDTAGGIMDTQLVRVFSHLSSADAIAEVRRQGRVVQDFYTVFVVDEGFHLMGTVSLNDLILADPLQPVAELVEMAPASVTPDQDQEEVGRLMSRYNIVSLPVVDPFGVLLGRITFDDVMDVMEEEQTEDILLLAGTSDEEELRGSWWEAVQTRLPWLVLNLATATLAASVVLKFAETVEQMVVLAFLMPIIAAMGGNAGTQALAVTIRRMATSSDLGGNSFDAVGKEVLVGLVNGLVLGLTIALFSGWLAHDARLGLVVLMAMWVNLVVAGFAGAFIPTILSRLGLDPAVASSVFVITLTDLCGFFLLLGLATAMLL